MTDVLEFGEFLYTGIHGVSLEQFVEITEKLRGLLEMDDEDIQFKDREESITTIMTYRDSANYKLSFALQLSGGGKVLMVEPDWLKYEEEEEEKEKDHLYNTILEVFKSPFY